MCEAIAVSHCEGFRRRMCHAVAVMRRGDLISTQAPNQVFLSSLIHPNLAQTVMIITVIVLNCIIALCGFYAAWQIWKLQHALAGATRALIQAEQSTYSVLHNAPELILKGQLGAYELRQRYQKLEPQFQKARQALALLATVQMIWRRSHWWRSSQPPAKMRRSGKRRSRQR